MLSKAAEKLAIFCQGKTIRCAVVEYDTALRVLIARVLRDLGLEVLAAENGREVVVAHYNQPFDLVILHWFNRGLNGEQTLETMNALSDQMPKVIIMTGQEAVSMHSPVPVAGFLFKPFDLDKLATVVLDALGGLDA
jgi:DNA-binding NtrC family response regulator